MGFHDCGCERVPRHEIWGTYPGLARALDDGAGLDDAVELEAAVLAHGRHDAHAGGGNLAVVEPGLSNAERVQPHARRARGNSNGGDGRVQLRAFRHGRRGRHGCACMCCCVYGGAVLGAHSLSRQMSLVCILVCVLSKDVMEIARSGGGRGMLHGPSRVETRRGATATCRRRGKQQATSKIAAAEARGDGLGVELRSPP
jgi:hypothetical protein